MISSDAGIGPDPRPLVDLLGLQPQAAQALGRAIEAAGGRVRSLLRADAWPEALAEAAPQALLVPAALCASASAVLEKLVLGDPRLCTTQLAAIGDGGQRLAAQLSGADLYLEAGRAGPALIDALGQRLVGWLQALDRRPFRVLVVDDDAEGRLYAGSILRRAGFEVEECAQPEHAVERAQALRPDLMLLDLYMPGLDGLAVIARLRAHEELAQLPIVILSGEERPAARFNALRLGADEFLVKPVRPQALAAALRSRIKRDRAARQALSPGAGQGPRMRRGDFLQELVRRVAVEGDEWMVLMALRVQDAAQQREQLGLGGVHALERALAARLRTRLGPQDRYSLWEELGFGLLVVRDSAEAVRALAEDLLVEVRSAALDLEGMQVPVRLSIGLALPPREAPAGVAAEGWIAGAFAAVSVAARLGGDRAEGVLSRDPDALPPERAMVIHNALADLARGGELRCEYQPLLCLNGEQPHYALVAKLRDLRAPLKGYPRREYLALAREHGQLAMLERMALFQAFETFEEMRDRGHPPSLLVPLDLASTDSRQLAWLEAELRRRAGLAGALRIELEAEQLHDPAHAETLKRLLASGCSLAACSRRPTLDLLQSLARLPLRLLRLPHPVLGSAPAEAITESIRGWHALGRELLVDEVPSVAEVGSLWSLGIDYLQGDVLAAAAPRPDYEGELD
ncbi:MAG: response regulator [Aquimonas sp.]|nr:response regulator [Aquimonas sp.]